MGARYPAAEWVPWAPRSETGEITYWRGACKPVAVVLHIMAGYAHTARDWAERGYYGASWHFTVARDGSVMQHLEIDDAAYQAGIPAGVPTPTWPLWRGDGQNVNWYTLGIEHEGFPGEPFTPEQATASRELCRWLSRTLEIPLDHDHWPAHAEIDVVNRRNDFNTPELRAEHYAYLFEEEPEMTDEQARQLAAVYAGMFAGDRAVEDKWIAEGVGTAQSVISIEGALNKLAGELTQADLANVADVLIAAGNAIKERGNG